MGHSPTRARSVLDNTKQAFDQGDQGVQPCLLAEKVRVSVSGEAEEGAIAHTHTEKIEAESALNGLNTLIVERDRVRSPFTRFVAGT